jgi:ribosomal protein S12 methylthiotransferase
VSSQAIIEHPAPAADLKPRPKVGFISLGCPKNLVDSEVMMGLLHRGGAELTPRAEDADILVVNTCSFIDSAKQESVDTILEMVNHKVAAGGRAQKLIVAGCLVERYRDEIQKNIPEVDAVVGTGELEAILEAAGLAYQPVPAATLPDSPFNVLTTAQIERHASAVNQHSRPESQSAQIINETTSRPEGDAREAAGRFSREAWDGATAPLPSYLYSDETPRILTTPRASAYIKIAEGCDHPCSFCIIPQLRGKFRSRPIASIVAEAKSLIAQGVREITLIGQDTTCYGEDLAPELLPATKPGAPSPSGAPLMTASSSWVGDDAAGVLRRPELADLLDALAPLPGLKWLRFLYAYPNKVTTRLLESIARHDNVAKYLDVPLQHASANVLRRMKRGGTADRFLQILSKARSIVPGLVLRTSFIVGFPGETEADFEELCAFVTAAKFDWLGVFSYSDEEGAAAFNEPAETKVPKRTIEARRRKLMRLQQKISLKARREWIGREVDILVEGESEETELLWQGRTLEMAPEIDGKVLINDFGPHEALVPGTFYRAEITESHDYDVVARILE